MDDIKKLEIPVDDSSVGRIGHEKIGEEYLRRLGFSESICRLVGSHVAAKRSRLFFFFICRCYFASYSTLCDAETLFRYLAAIDSFYYDGLSDASKKSLELQGGPFKGGELIAFESDPLKEDMVRLRMWDDKSKIVGIVEKTPRADNYEPLIKKHLLR